MKLEFPINCLLVDGTGFLKLIENILDHCVIQGCLPEVRELVFTIRFPLSCCPHNTQAKCFCWSADWTDNISAIKDRFMTQSQRQYQLGRTEWWLSLDQATWHLVLTE